MYNVLHCNAQVSKDYYNLSIPLKLYEGNSISEKGTQKRGF